MRKLMKISVKKIFTGGHKARPYKMATFVLSAFALALVGCSSIECPMNSHVYCNYGFYVPGDTAVSLNYLLSVTTTRFDGNDTTLLNKQANAHKIQLPMSYMAAVDTLRFTLEDEDGASISDVVYVEKRNLPHMESVECGTTIFHELVSVSCTHNFLDSVVIKNKKVNYDTQTEHIFLYPKH